MAEPALNSTDVVSQRCCHCIALVRYCDRFLEGAQDRTSIQRNQQSQVAAQAARRWEYFSGDWRDCQHFRIKQKKQTTPNHKILNEAGELCPPWLAQALPAESGVFESDKSP